MVGKHEGMAFVLASLGRKERKLSHCEEERPQEVYERRIQEGYREDMDGSRILGCLGKLVDGWVSSVSKHLQIIALCAFASRRRSEHPPKAGAEASAARTGPFKRD